MSNDHKSASPYGSKRMIEAVLPYMRQVQLLERELHALEMRWDLVESTARMVCPAAAAKFLPTLKVTRGQFSNLQDRLLHRVAETQVANKHFQLISHAQVMIDLLVRGLYERTADVGFIASDPDLIALTVQPDEAASVRLRARLQEYCAKYTVYSDIIVLDPQARVLCRLDQHAHELAGTEPEGLCASGWFNDAKNRRGYAQSFEQDPLFPGQGRVLLYAHRIEGPHSGTAGVVVLKFDFDSELKSIFSEVDDGDRHAIVTLIDENNIVIASSRPSGVAVGDIIDSPDPKFPVVLHHDAEYLACSRTSRGYQGYMGLPWRAQAMTKLDTAFRTSIAEQAGEDSDASEDELLRAIMNNDANLMAIIDQASSIEQGLEQVTWNGKLDHNMQSDAGQSTSAVFDQIHETGRRTTRLFSEGIMRLCKLAATGRRTELQGRAKTAINILDRNLYERANDCRWWALSSNLRESLEQMNASPSDAQAQSKAEQVLGHLNSLYSVYRRIALCTEAGKVVAVSRDSDTLAPDLRLPDALAQQVRGLPNSQAYAVSAFEPTALADDKPSYVFLANIRHPATRASIGSVALAFDADKEFSDMLGAAVPPNGSLSAVFMHENGQVIAATNPQWQAGERFAAIDSIAVPEAGKCSMQMLTINNERFLAVIAASNGYREFKRTDGYSDPLLALVLQPLPLQRRHTEDIAHTSISGQPGAEIRIGLFRSNDLLLGINTNDIIEAIRAPRIVPLPGMHSLCGVVEQRAETGTRLIPVMDFRFLNKQQLTAEEHRDVTVVVVNHEGRPLGLWVDRLLTVIDLPPSAIKPAGSVGGASPWIVGFVSDDAPGSPLITIVDINKLSVGELHLPDDLAMRLNAETAPGLPKSVEAPVRGAGAGPGLINTTDEVAA